MDPDTGRTRQPRVMRYLEWGLLAIGLTFLALFLAFRVDAEVASRSALRKFAAQNRSAVSAGGGLAGPKTRTSACGRQNRIAAYEQSLAKMLAVRSRSLTIRRLGLDVPVFEGTDDLTLNRGAGRILDTAEPGGPGKMGLAAHRDGFFRGLKDVLLGDEVVLALPGRTVRYVVDEIEIVTPEDVGVLRPRAHPALTLVTCYPFYFVGSAPQRFIVHASVDDTEIVGPPDLPCIRIHQPTQEGGRPLAHTVCLRRSASPRASDGLARDHFEFSRTLNKENGQ